MKIKTITYKKIKNLGNYQSETVEMCAELDESENVELASKALKQEVFKALDLLPSRSADDNEELF